MPSNLKHFYDFGAYRVDVGERLLLRAEEVVPLSPKAFDMLLVLLEGSGRLLAKEELMRRVWPDSFVEEANLSHNIYKLREALGQGSDGEKFIETVPRRGYRFVAKVTEIQDDSNDLTGEEHSRARIVVEEDDRSDNLIETPAASTLQPRALPSRFHRSPVGRPTVVIAATLFLWYDTVLYRI